VVTQRLTAWVAALALVGTLTGTAVVRAGSGSVRVAPDLGARLADAANHDTFAVVVATAADPAAIQQRLGVTGVTFERAMRGFAATLTAEQIRQLQAQPGVEAISADTIVRVTSDSAGRSTGAAAARSDFGVTGDGDGLLGVYSTQDVVIAVVDTGIDAAHKDLAGKVLAWKDLVNDQAQPYDDHGHGTHVAGIAAGAGVANPAMRGVAPGAALVGVKVLAADGSAEVSRVVAGVEWVLEHKEQWNIKVLKRDALQVLP
jgi:serine protease AprX